MTGELGDGDLDLPFEESPGQILEGEDMHVAGGVVVLAATVCPEDQGTFPVLIFRFAKADGTGFHKALMLVMTNDQADKLPQLISEAVASARRAAEAANN